MSMAWSAGLLRWLGTNCINGTARDLRVAVEKRPRPFWFLSMQLAQLIERARRGAATRLHRLVQLGRQIEQREVVCHGGLIHAQPLGDRRVRVAGIGPCPYEARQVERRQAVALLILGNLHVGIGRCLAQYHGHLGQPRTACCPPALGAEVDAVTPLCVGGMNDKRLQDAVLADVFGEFVDLRFGKLGAWIVRVFVQPIRRHDQRTPFFAYCGRCRWQSRMRTSTLVRRSLIARGRNVRIGFEKLELIGLRFGPRQSHEPIVPSVRPAR